MTRRVHLDLDQLRKVSRLSSAVLGALAEAARVMLDRYHSAPPPPSQFVIRRLEEDTPAEIQWREPTNQERDTHANEKDAAEDGACAVAIATVAEADYIVVRCTRQGPDVTT